MALVKCTNCKNKVSDTVNECIHCRKPLIKVNRCIECNTEMFDAHVCDVCGYEDLDKKTRSVCKVITKSSKMVKYGGILFGILITVGTFFSPNTWFIHLLFGLLVIVVSFIIESFINWPVYILRNLQEIKNKKN